MVRQNRTKKPAMDNNVGDQTKNFLIKWLCKKQGRKNGPVGPVNPSYNCVAVGASGPFHCELSIEGYSHISVAYSTSKKESKTSAAKDFLRYLITTNKMSRRDIPPKTYDQICSGWENPPDFGSDSDEDEEPSKKFLDDFDYDADLNSNAEQCGNWTVDTAKTCLNNFAQKNKIKLQYQYGSINHGWDRCELSCSINGVISVEEFGATQNIASKRCALIMIRRLFELGYIEASDIVPKAKATKSKSASAVPPVPCSSQNGTGQLPKTKPATATGPVSARQIPSLESISVRLEKEKPYAFPMHLDPSLMSEVHEVLKERGIQPPQHYSIILNPDADAYDDFAYSPLHQNEINGTPGIVEWAPPKPNWNPWTCSEISEDPQHCASLEEISESLSKSFKAFAESQELNSRTREMQASRKSLPIFQIKSQIVNTIKENSVVLIKGDTGCGKTTQICQYILDDYLLSGKGASCNVLVTQPRRISAIGVAERVAAERAEEVGVSVGLSIKLESSLPRPWASILFCTTGILLRKMETGLAGISHVIVDEIHERDINTDFLLIILRDMVQTYPDLRVILMSATMDTSIFEHYFEGSTTIHVSGRAFPVQTFFLEDTIETIHYTPSSECLKRMEKSKQMRFGRNAIYSWDGEVEQNMNDVPIGAQYSRGTREVMKLLEETVEVNLDLLVNLLMHIRDLPHKGAILIFLPGWKDIFQTLRFLQKHAVFGSSSYNLIPLHSQVPKRDQCRVFERVPESVTKIIISTNIAETSITIDDVVYVIDSCQAKAKIFTSHNNTSNYVTMWGSKSNLAQRCGRAGRVRPGYCFHLCSWARFNRLDANIIPEILRDPLYGVALSIKLLGLGGIAQFLAKAPEYPPFHAVLEAEKLLYNINCLTPSGELTPLGRIIAKLPLHPRIGKMLLLGTIFTCVDPLSIIAAYFSNSRDIFKFDMDLDFVTEPLTKEQREFAGTTHSDHFAQLNAFQEWFSHEDNEYEFCKDNSLSLPSLRTTCDEKNHLLNVLADCGFPYESFNSRLLSFRNGNPALDIIAGLLCVGFYPNVCLHIDKRRVVTNDSKAVIHKTSVTTNPQAKIKFPYPYFIFQEKIRAGIVTCKGLTMVSPLHLLLFGSKKVEVIEPTRSSGNGGVICLDNWIFLRMKPEDAAAIVGIRSAVEEMVLRVAEDPGNSFPPSPSDRRLIYLVEQLCALDSPKGQIFEPYIEDENADYQGDDDYDYDGGYYDQHEKENYKDGWYSLSISDGYGN